MSNTTCISIIVPIFNGEIFIKNFFKLIIKQTFKEKTEIIVINDGSTDKTLELLKSINLSNLKLFSLKKNSGPAAARNLGLKKAIGEYVFFIDIDDAISNNALEVLYATAKKYKCEYVCSDFQRFENNTNQRKKKYNYSKNIMFRNVELKQAMVQELHDPTLGHLGLFGCNGRLIKRSLLKKNKIYFCSQLRWLEDKIFSWRVLSYVKSAKYIKKQLYKYYVHPNLNSGVIQGISKNFTFETIKLIINNIRKSLKIRGFGNYDISKLCQQGIIFFCIQFLVSISRSIILKKINNEKGIKIRKKFMKEIIKNTLIQSSIKIYKISKKESPLIPKAILDKSVKNLEFQCDLRAKEVIKSRRLGKS